MHLSLARKYRPKTFADVAVQSHVSNTLKGAIARGRVAHGYLLCGPRGVGKTTLARVLAMALNCENKREDGEPCGECTSCQRIWSGSASLDVVEIDAASNRGVDDARDLRERAMYSPSGDDRYKVYIVDEAHMLTREAWNALLKILEEPPPRVVFVFATTEPQKIAQAAAPVLSRLQRFDFKRIGPADVRLRLNHVLAAEGITAENDALAMIARAADGSMRDALSLTDQVLALGDGTLTPARVREALGLVAEDEFIAMLDLIAERRAGDVFAAVARLVDAGVDLVTFLAGFVDTLRAQLALALRGELADVSDVMRAALAERRDRFTPGDLLRMLSVVSELEPRFRRSGQQQVLLESLLVRFALLDHTLAIEEVLRGIGGGGPPAATPREARRQSEPSPRSAPAPRPAREGASRESASRGGAPSAAAPPGPRASVSAAPAVATAAVPDEVRAPAPRPARPAEPLDLVRLAEKWDDVLGRVRAGSARILSAALERSIPVAVTAKGEITVELEEANDIYEHAIASGAATVLDAVSAFFAGATRLIVQRGGGAADGESPRRLTEEALRSERVAKLRKRDPVLDAAVEILDLELLD